MAKILVLQGKNKGETFVLEDEQTFIGRDSSNQITLNDASVSRRHCVIEKRENQFYINDLQSLNGTFVNEKTAENLLLQEKDRIRVGDFTLVFSSENNSDEQLSGKIHFDDSQLDLSQTLHLKIEDVISAMARDLSSLLKISEKINRIRGLENLQKELLDEIFEVVPASEGAILFVDEDEDFAETFARRRNDETAEINVSRTIVKRVLDEQEAILANEFTADENLKTAESLFISQTSAVLCVPLVLFGKKLGVIYLAVSQNSAKFDESHLRFLTAVAGISAVAIENLRNIEFLERENARLRDETLGKRNLLGESEAIKKVLAIISRVAPTDSTVLITGESGTGKELAARAIHLNSPRRDKPFVAINCAALSENLLESELFGHERGAFTGAVVQKRGKIEFAQGGTLFLDEIGEMAVALQAKLLRVLQEREYERVGGLKSLKADVRLIAATNKDLENEIKNGVFRQDLFYRINVINIKMPALRERDKDILTLAESFAEKFAAKFNRRLRGLSAKAKKILLNYDFPGNVRELENAIERAVVLGLDEWILPEDLPESFRESNADDEFNEAELSNLPYHEVIQAKKKEIIFKAFAEAKGSYVETAKILDIHPNYLHRLIRNLNIKSELENLPTA